MTTFLLQVGDVHADGHGMFEEVHVQVPDKFSRETLRANFKDAKKKLGIDPKRFAENYEEYTVDREKLQPLFDAGFTFSENTETQWYFEEKGLEEDNVGLHVESLVEILMFFYGYELEGFIWEVVEKPPVLNEESYGYGLFML